MILIYVFLIDHPLKQPLISNDNLAIVFRMSYLYLVERFPVSRIIFISTYTSTLVCVCVYMYVNRYVQLEPQPTNYLYAL